MNFLVESGRFLWHHFADLGDNHVETLTPASPSTTQATRGLFCSISQVSMVFVAISNVDFIQHSCFDNICFLLYYVFWACHSYWL